MNPKGDDRHFPLGSSSTAEERPATLQGARKLSRRPGRPYRAAPSKGARSRMVVNQRGGSCEQPFGRVVDLSVSRLYRPTKIGEVRMLAPDEPICPTRDIPEKLLVPIEPDMRPLLESVQLHKPLDVRLAAPRDDFLNPLHAGAERLVADQHIDALFLRRHRAKHPHDALDVLPLGLIVIREPPRPTVDRLPARVNLIVKGARLKSRVRVEQRDARALVSADDMVLIFWRERREIVVAEDGAHREVRQLGEGLPFHLRHDAKPTSDRTASAGEGGGRVVPHHGIRVIATDLGYVRQIMFAGEDAGTAGANLIAETPIPGGPHPGVVEQPRKRDREIGRVTLNPLGKAA